jgi:hypothetical protein
VSFTTRIIIKEEAMPLAPNKSTTTKTATIAYQEPAPSSQSCCRLMNFERPNYFAGHLLTDADLLLEQRYIREKMKLYHRSLHGSGVVCGLRLTCDHNCAGGILVGRGYAIDDCGNDLVLPERQPLDVISLLIQKGLILPEPAPDPCRPKNAESECHLQQCFYITICYTEDQVDFATPLVATCQTTSSECEPTRILETVSLDVVDTLPGVQPGQDALKNRLETCFKLFSDGAFAQALHRHQKTLGEIITPPAESHKALEHHTEYHKLFFELRGLLLLYLNKHPDKYNCTIDDEIRKVRFPEIHRHSDKAQEKYLEELRDSFSCLLALAWQHAVSCALGEFVPSCVQVCEASCVSLGAVIVENGRIVRVCNCPRSYVWSAANFREVLLATTLGELACQNEREDDSQSEGERNNAKMICCRDFDFDLECFLRWLNVSPKAPFYAATELLRWLETFPKSIQEGFDFTNPCNFSPKISEGMDEKKATDFLKTAGIQSRTTEAPLETKPPDLFALIQTAGLATVEKPIVLAVKESTVSSATLENPELLAHINNLYSQISSLKASMDRIHAQRSTG